MPTGPLKITILGGGIAGLTTALALARFTPPSHPPASITIYEIRPAPATIGGAVNLTPNALRLLSHLGALQEIRAAEYGKECGAVEVFDLYSGVKIAESSFRGAEGKGLGDPPFGALRITRGDALKGVLAAIKKHDNITLIYGKKTVKITEDEDYVQVHFEDGSTAAKADILLGCDGIHSITRLSHVESSRTATYSGICNAFGFAPRRRQPDGTLAPTHFETTAINFGRRGMLLTSFFDDAQEHIYVGALMQVPELADRNGWKAAGADADKIRAEMLDRYAGAAHDGITHGIEDAQDLFLWPVFTLSKGGKWATQRTMLIGDSAHAMPPQGESTGIVFEDGVLFARCLARWSEMGRAEGVPVKEAFDAYERLRRTRIDVAWDESQSVVKTVNDTPWWGHKVKMTVVPWYLWWTRAYREKHFVEDVTTCELGY